MHDELQIDEALASYLNAVLFTSRDESWDELGRSFSAHDFAPAALHQARRDVASFLHANARHIGDHVDAAGGDFWLTRNRAGGGFWDGDWPEPAATVLTHAAHAAGSVIAYLGDDRKVHFSNEGGMLAAFSPAKSAAPLVVGALGLAGLAGLAWYLLHTPKA